MSRDGGGTTSEAGGGNALLGRIAVHYKLITPDQLADALRIHGRPGQTLKLGEVLLRLGHLTPERLSWLLEVQRQYVTKRRESEVTARASRLPASPPAIVAQAEASRVRDLDVARLLAQAVRAGASDVHLHVGLPVQMRIHGRLFTARSPVLDRATAEASLLAILTPEQRALVASRGDVDFAYEVPGAGRFRANVYRQQRGIDGVFRVVPATPPTLEQLGLPEQLAKLTTFHQGLVLLTGPAGCGKSATMAALVDLVNGDRRDHVITIEDPIEVLHPSKLAIVNQRQVERHTASFATALRAALREDPDVIAIGELRDLETVSLAITAAETGHLVLATLHTNSAIRSIGRLLDVFPTKQQPQIRAMVSESLRAVVSQRLVPLADGTGRVPALEILHVNHAVSNLIRDEKTFQLRTVLQMGRAQGMCLLDDALAELVRGGLVTLDAAKEHAEDERHLLRAAG